MEQLKIPRIIDLSRFMRRWVEVKLDGCDPIEGVLVHLDKNVFLKLRAGITIVRGQNVYAIGIKSGD